MTTPVVEELKQQSHQLEEEAKGFGDKEIVTCAELDPQEYYKRDKHKQASRKQKYGRFIKFTKISLKERNLWDDDISNAVVRDDQNSDHADEDIAYSYKKDGWFYDPFPPIMGTDGKFKDGRTRVRAALIAGWDYILVAIYSYDEEIVDQVFAEVTNGLIANNHTVARSATMNDFVKGGIALVRAGLLEREHSAIEEWLLNDVEIANFFDIDSGTHTKIKNRIFDGSAEKSDIILNKSREEWIEYLAQCPEFKELGILLPDSPNPFGENQLILYSASKTNARRCYCDSILNNQSKDKDGCKHTYIALYSNAETEEKVREAVSSFVNDLNSFFVKSVNMVNDMVNGITIEVPDGRSYTIIGVVPLFYFNDLHKELRSLNRLVPVGKL